MATATRIGTMIRRARERKRMSQQQLADAVGVSRSAVNAWERGRALPRSSLGALEDVLGVSLYDEPAQPPPLVPEDKWEAGVLSDDDLPDEVKRQLILDSRAARDAYRQRKAARAPSARDRAG